MAKKVYTYEFDDGTTAAVELDEFYGEQACFGWVDAAPTEHVINQGGRYKLRCALVVTEAGITRRIPCGVGTATAYTTPNTACSISTLTEGRDEPFPGKSYGHEGERLRNSKSRATFGA